MSNQNDRERALFEAHATAQEERIEHLEVELQRAQLPAGGEVPDVQWQHIDDGDLDSAEKFINERFDPGKCLFLPADAYMLANMALHCIREVRATRAAAPHPVSGERKPAAPEWEDRKHLTSVIKSVVARERMRPELRTDQEVADAIYHAVAEHLPVYEDVYDQCGEMIEPYVVRPYRKDGMLPGSVVDSMRMLLDYRLSNQSAAQDVAGLVEALEEIAGGRSSKSDPYIARQALATHRAQAQGGDV